jgi:hypothetical protein
VPLPVTLFLDGGNFWLADGFAPYHTSLQANLGQSQVRLNGGIERE